MLSRSTVVQSLRSIRDRFFDTRRQRNEQSDGQGTSNDVTGPSLDNLSVRHDFFTFHIYLPDVCTILAYYSTYQLLHSIHYILLTETVGVILRIYITTYISSIKRETEI